MDSKSDVAENTILRLGPRAFELDEAASLTAAERLDLELERAAYFNWAAAMAERVRIPLTVGPTASIRDLDTFVREALRIDLQNLAYIEEHGVKLTRDQRREYHERLPGFARVTAAEIRDEIEQGAHGLQAIEQAATRKLRRLAFPTQRVAPQGKRQACTSPSRPRERAGRRKATGASSASSDDGPEPPPAPAGAAYELSCHCCGDGFTSARPHTRTCSARCRKRLHLEGRKTVAMLEWEPLAVDEVRGGRLAPEDALFWVVFPEACRERAAVAAA